MKKILYTLALAAIAIGTSLGQSKKEVEAIKDFCGCFEVEFKYAETFAEDTGYVFHEPYTAKALELVVLDEESNDKLVLQHVLIVDDTMIIKHWRQDWEYQQSDAFAFEGNNTWSTFAHSKGDVSGQWSQEVYGTDDTPRYQGSSTWFLNDGKKTWTNVADAPLPRREYKKRSDYQVMRRTNRLSIEDWGWVHEQDNEKVIVDESGERVLVEEKGRNTYVRTDDAKCAKAAEWWQQHRDFWVSVREVWNEYLDEPRSYSVVKKQDHGFLPYALKDLSKKGIATKQELRSEIRKTLDAYREDITASTSMNE